MSAMSRGRWAIAFITIRSSGVIIGTESPAIRRRRPRATMSYSNGSAPTLTSRSIPLGSWRRRSTRVRRAMAMVSARRGEIANRAPVATKASQSSSGTSTRASIFPVTLGRPRSEAATPPITTPRAFDASSHAINARRAPTSGAASGVSATQRPSNPCLLRAHCGILRAKTPRSAERRGRHHQGGKALQALGDRHPSECNPLGCLHAGPARAIAGGLSARHHHGSEDRASRLRSQSPPHRAWPAPARAAGGCQRFAARAVSPFRARRTRSL